MDWNAFIPTRDDLKNPKIWAALLIGLLIGGLLL